MPARKFIRVPITQKLLIYIFSKIHVSTEHFYKETPCWEWTRNIRKDGYGKMYYDGRTTVPHRVIYQLFIEEIPPRLEADHLCRRRHCVNPVHIEPVPPKVNKLRGEGYAAKNAKKTHCKNGHPLPLKRNKQGERICRICQRERTKDHRLKNVEHSRAQDRDYRRAIMALPPNHPKRVRKRHYARTAYRKLYDLPYNHPRRIQARQRVQERRVRQKSDIHVS